MGYSDRTHDSDATRTIQRQLLSLSVRTPTLIKSNISFPCLPLENRVLYFAPDAILIEDGDTIAALSYEELTVSCKPLRFLESETVPHDTQIVGGTWLYSDRDGTPDGRFSSNQRVPICLYGEIHLKSVRGLNAVIHCSHLDAAKDFCKTLVDVAKARAQLERHGEPSSVPPPQLDGRELIYVGDRPPGVSPLKWGYSYKEDNVMAEQLAAYASETERAQLLVQKRERFWEFLLAEELLKSKLTTFKHQYDDFDNVLSTVPVRQFTSVQEFGVWFSSVIAELKRQVEGMSKSVFDLRDSMGPPGVSGDPIQILRSVNELFDRCRAVFNIELDFCAANPPLKLKVISNDFRGLTLSFIQFAEQLTDLWSKNVEGIQNGSREFPLYLHFPTPPQLQEVQADFDDITDHPEFLL